MEQTLFTQFLLQFGKSSPLFLLIFLGFALSRWFGFNKTASTVLSRFAFNIALPAMLFRLLSNLALTESHADLRLLIAFFGACFILFLILFSLLHILPRIQYEISYCMIVQEKNILEM